MSIFPKLLFYFLATTKAIAVPPAWLTSFIARVTADGGTLYDQGHTVQTYNNTSPYSPTVIQPCDTGKPTVLYNIVPDSPPADFTVSRIDDKYVLGSGGTLVSYAIDDPAIEFNPDGTYKGLPVETAATNSALQSEDLDNGTYWLTANSSIAANTQTDPKGGTNSFLLAEVANIGVHSFLINGPYRPTININEYWTQSVYLKKGTGASAPDIVQLTFGTSTHLSTQYANFNISTGTVLTTSGGTADIRDMGDGWYRCSWTAKANQTGIQGGIVGLVFTDNNDSLGRAPSYGGQTSADVFIWGAQLEKNRTATSYIPTTTTAVNRVKDEIELAGASSLIGQTEGTIYIEVDWQRGDLIRYLIALSDNSNANRIHISNDSGVLLMRVSATGDVVYQGVPSSGFTGVQRFAFAYKDSDFELYRNGSSVSTKTSGSLAALGTLTQINLGSSFDRFFQANMWIRSAALYNTRLSAADMEALTKGDGYFVGVNEDVFGTSNVTFSER
jgi:hypothetical protein